MTWCLTCNDLVPSGNKSLHETMMIQLVHVMTWCCQATSHYMNQWWSSFTSPYGVIRQQWVNIVSIFLLNIKCLRMCLSWDYLYPLLHSHLHPFPTPVFICFHLGSDLFENIIWALVLYLMNKALTVFDLWICLIMVLLSLSHIKLQKEQWFNLFHPISPTLIWFFIINIQVCKTVNIFKNNTVHIMWMYLFGECKVLNF